MCTDGLEHGLVAAYSYGVNGFDRWGMELARKYHIPLYEYDCTNPLKPEPCAGCDVHFNLECITSAKNTASLLPNSAYKTFAQHLAANGHAQKDPGNILLKIDTEGAEWQTFAD